MFLSHVTGQLDYNFSVRFRASCTGCFHLDLIFYSTLVSTFNYEKKLNMFFLRYKIQQQVTAINLLIAIHVSVITADSVPMRSCGTNHFQSFSYPHSSINIK